MKKRVTNGFTLIELVIVVVVLAILAVIAIPKFTDLKKDAVASNITGVGGALGSALIFVKSAVEIENAEGSIEYLGTTLSLTEGMPIASAGSLRAMLDIEVPNSFTRNWETVACDEPEFCILGNMYLGKSGYVPVPGFNLVGGTLDRVSYIWPAGYTLSTDGCYSYYINESTQKAYHSGSITDGC